MHKSRTIFSIDIHRAREIPSGRYPTTLNFRQKDGTVHLLYGGMLREPVHSESGIPRS